MTDRRRRFEAQALPHLDAAYNLARWLVRPPLDAEDIVQDAMLRAYRAFDTVRGENVKAWLLTIVRNCFLTAAEQNKNRQNSPLPADDEISAGDSALIAGDADPEATVIQDQTRRHLDRLLSALPHDFREVLVLRELEDLSYSEIAKIVGIPVGTVMSRLARARALLRENWHVAEKGDRHVLQ